MDEADIQEELITLQSMHESLDTDNPITYAILLERCKDKLNEDQINYINSEIKRLKKKEEKIYKKWLEKFQDPISREPLLSKIPEK